MIIFQAVVSEVCGIRLYLKFANEQFFGTLCNKVLKEIGDSNECEGSVWMDNSTSRCVAYLWASTQHVLEFTVLILSIKIKFSLVP